MRVFLTLTILLAGLSAFAQSRKGKFLLAGDTRANFLTVTGISGNQVWDLGTSRIGYFVLDELVVGTEVSLRTNLFAFATPEDFRINPFVRYYLSELDGKQMQYFAQLGIGTFGAFSDFGSTASFETDFHIGLGAEYQVANNLLAEGLLRYNAKAFGLNYTELSLRMNVLLGKNDGEPRPPLGAKDIMINPNGGNLQLGLRGREGVNHLIADLTLEGGVFFSKHVIAEAGFSIERDAYRADPGNFEGVRNRPLITQIVGFIGTRLLLPSEQFKPYLQARLSHFSQTTGFDDQVGRRSTTDASGQLGLGAGTFLFITDNVAFDFAFRRQFALRPLFLDQWEGSAGLKVFFSPGS